MKAKYTINISFIQTSALRDENVMMAAQKLASMINNKQKERRTSKLLAGSAVSAENNRIALT